MFDSHIMWTMLSHVMDRVSTVDLTFLTSASTAWICWLVASTTSTGAFWAIWRIHSGRAILHSRCHITIVKNAMARVWPLMYVSEPGWQSPWSLCATTICPSQAFDSYIASSFSCQEVLTKKSKKGLVLILVNPNDVRIASQHQETRWKYENDEMEDKSLVGQTARWPRWSRWTIKITGGIPSMCRQYNNGCHVF